MDFKKFKRCLALMLVIIMASFGMQIQASAATLKLKNASGTKTMSVGSTYQLKTNINASKLTFNLQRSR